MTSCLFVLQVHLQLRLSHYFTTAAVKIVPQLSHVSPSSFHPDATVACPTTFRAAVPLCLQTSFSKTLMILKPAKKNAVTKNTDTCAGICCRLSCGAQQGRGLNSDKQRQLRWCKEKLLPLFLPSALMSRCGFGCVGMCLCMACRLMNVCLCLSGRSDLFLCLNILLHFSFVHCWSSHYLMYPE